MTTFNEFNKQLRDRKIDPNVAYMFGLVYERVLDCAKQIDMCANLVDQMADAMKNALILHEHTAKALQELKKEMNTSTPGVSVSSEPTQ